MISLVQIPVFRCYIGNNVAWGMGMVVIGLPTSIAFIVNALLPRMHSGG